MFLSERAAPALVSVSRAREQPRHTPQRLPCSISRPPRYSIALPTASLLSRNNAQSCITTFAVHHSPTYPHRVHPAIACPRPPVKWPRPRKKQRSPRRNLHTRRRYPTGSPQPRAARALASSAPWAKHCAPNSTPHVHRTRSTWALSAAPFCSSCLAL